MNGRHPKDILRSLGHELVHHKQNCDGQFDNAGETVEGYEQTNPHLRQWKWMPIEMAVCVFVILKMLKKENTIYYEHLKKEKTRCLQKIGKTKVTQLLAEAWGFKFNTLEEFNEFNGEGELQAEGDEEIEELAQLDKQRIVVSLKERASP